MGEALTLVRTFLKVHSKGYGMIDSHPKGLTTRNLALIGILSALWVALNLTIAPIAFTLTHLPTVHSTIIFITLILAVWATGQYGAASTVAIIGSIIVVLTGGPLPVVGFIPAALIFDVILLVNHHRINLRKANITVAIIASIACAYVAALANGVLILNFPLPFTLTVWAAWNILGAVIGVAIILPIIMVLERANVKKVKA